MQLLAKLLLIEDDRGFSSALRHALANTYNVDCAPTGKLALYKADAEEYDLIVLDLHLPDQSGLVICQQLRERGHTQPILILTGEAKVLTKISLLDSGANDYLTKPFSLGELKARLRVLSRDNQVLKKESKLLEIGDVSLDTANHQVTRAGQPIHLRRKEFTLLECLMRHSGGVVSRETLIRYAWRGDDTPWTNTIDVHIKYLRDKIDRPFDTPFIRTVHGLGYKVEVPVSALLIAGKA